jgi:peptidoglycan/LPS O-acetylase OafA/YrhL
MGVGRGEPRVDNREARTAVLRPLVGIRFIAVAATVFHHSGASWLSAQAWAPRPLANMALHAPMGLGFFFVLSGFILQTLYRGRLAETGAWRRYGVSRVARIYPVYLIGVLLMAPAYAVADWGAIPQFFLVQCWTLFTTNWGWQNWNPPAWMLSIEFFFYLCFPLMCGAIERAPRRALIAGVAAVVLFVLITGSANPPDAHQRFVWMEYVPLPVLRLPEFVAGTLIAEWQARRGVRKLPVAPELALVAFAVVLGWNVFPAQAALACILATLVILGLVNAPHAPFTRLMNTRPFLLLGAASYALYILHEPVNFALRAIAGGRSLLALQYPIDLVLSIAVLFLIETPARKWINARFATIGSRRGTEEVASPASATSF